MKKKVLAICLLTVMLLAVLSGCGDTQEFLTIGDYSINKGLYTYYLDKVLSAPEEYGVEADDRDGAVGAALDCCKKYVAAQSFMAEKQFGLSTENKQAAATEVEMVWSLYGGYYSSIGVTKQDINLAVAHEYRLRQIVDYYYGPSGLEPIDEWELKEEFVDLYVGFRAVTAPLTKINTHGETVPLTEAEQEALLNLFRAYRTEINEGAKTIDDINVEYNNTIDIIVTESLEINVVKIGDPMYTEDFYSTMLEISHDKAGIILCGNMLYLVQREKIATTAEDEFYLYRKGLIEELKMDEIKQNITELASELEADLDKSAAKEIYELLSDKRGKENPSEKAGVRLYDQEVTE